MEEDNSYSETNRFNRENHLKDSVIRDGYGAYIEDGYIKFGEKNECKALQIFKMWYTRSKLSANVFLKQSLKQYKEVE